LDTRGTLFFEIERILKDKNPYGFILENVEGLVKHDLENKNDNIGRTLKTILHTLKEDLGYNVSWKVFDSIEFGLPQSRKRIFLVGTKKDNVDLKGHEVKYSSLKSIFEKGLKTMESDFINKIFSNFKIKDLYGKSIKDKRGGENNIHSWDIGIKGEVTKEQSLLLNKLFKERRKSTGQRKLELIGWMECLLLLIK